MGLFNFFKRKDNDQNKSHLLALMEMAMADGEIDRFEWEYLQSIADRMGISESELNALKNHTEHYEYVPPKSKKEKFQRLYELVCMMMIDGEIHNKEKKMCSIFAKKLGFAAKYVDELVYSVGQNVSMGNSSDETMKRVSFMLDQV